jgi:5-(carboxyamino)imidazole ribonucleotide mutase
MPEIGIILGSDSDLPGVEDCFRLLDEFGVDFEIIISSAHRTPDKTMEWAHGARDRGIQVIIAVAGGAAHLPGVVASHTTIPVIGVPVQTNIAGGLDSVLSILQMPSGIPVATMPVGKSGGMNAALFAVGILALKDKTYLKKLEVYREKFAGKISAKNKELKSSGYSKYINNLREKK